MVPARMRLSPRDPMARKWDVLADGLLLAVFAAVFDGVPGDVAVIFQRDGVDHSADVARRLAYASMVNSAILTASFTDRFAPLS